MNKYKIEISERLTKIVEITAKTDQEAFLKAQKMYKEKKIILNNLNDFEDYDLEIIEAEEISPEF